MALYDLHRSSDTPVATVLAYRAASFIYDFVAGFATSQNRRPPRSLMRLTDSQLADIGLTRADLTRR